MNFLWQDLLVHTNGHRTSCIRRRLESGVGDIPNILCGGDEFTLREWGGGGDVLSHKTV